MNGHGYVNVVSPTPTKPPLGSQELNFRWPHIGTNNERDSQMVAHIPDKNYTPRLDGKYTAIRNPCDVRSRYDASTMIHDEQQRLHALYMEQFYKGTNNDMRVLQVGSDIRFPVYDVRQSFLKKGVEEAHTHEMQKSSFEGQHYLQDTKIGYSDGEGRYFQNGYTAPSLVNGKPLYNEAKRFASLNVEVSDQQAKVSAAMVTSIPSPQHISQKLNEPLNGNLNIFSENINNLTYIKEESASKRPNVTIADAPMKGKRGDHFENFLSIDNNAREKEHNANKEKQNIEEFQKTNLTGSKVKSDKDKMSNSEKSPAEKVSGNETTDNGLPSYTAMIAQAILKKSSKSTLSDIYEYMEKTFPSLEKRGTGWRNCVRHTLSLNDCFLKLHRPENGRSCNWTIHPSYYESFSRGDYRKKRALRKRARGLQWMDPMIFNGYPLMREHDIHSEVNQQQHTFLHHSIPPSMWGVQNGYNCSFVQSSPDHLHHFTPHPPSSHPPPSPSSNTHTQSYGTEVNHPVHFESANCTNPECYCQYNRNNCRVYSM